MILIAVNREEEERREAERMEEGWDREGGRGETKRRDDGCSLAPALPSDHRGCESFCRAEERMLRKEEIEMKNRVKRVKVLLVERKNRATEKRGGEE